MSVLPTLRVKTAAMCAALMLCVIANGGIVHAAETNPAFDHAGFARQTLDKVIRPGAEAFAAAAVGLQGHFDRVCGSSRRSAFAKARQAFRETALAYGRIEMLRLGPFRDGNRQERLLIYPDPKGLVRKQVDKVLEAKDETVLTAASLRGKSVALQGFSALEILMYGDGADTLQGASEPGRFRCGYARAIAHNIAALASSMAADWARRDGYAHHMLHPAADNPAYLKDSEVTHDLAGAFVNGIEQVRDVRLAAPLGLRDPAKSATTPIFDLSGLTTAYIAANLDGLITLYRASGLETQLARQDPAIANLIEREMLTARKNAQAVKVPFAKARMAPALAQRLTAMGFPLKNARALSADLIAKASGVPMGFNAGDGD